MNFLSHSTPLYGLMLIPCCAGDERQLLGIPLTQHDPNMASTLPNWRCSSAGTWHIAFQRWSCIYHDMIDNESINVTYTTILHCVGHCRFEKLLNRQCRFFASKP